MTRRAAFGLLALLVFVAVVGSVIWYTIANPVETKSVSAKGVELRVDFGLRETPLTRFFDIDVCSLSHQAAFKECSNDKQGKAPGSGGGQVATARTEVSSAAVIADLGEVDADHPFVKERGCNFLDRGSQYPASQFKTTAENRGSRGLAVTVTADPNQPEEVAPGTYCGAVVVQLATGGFVRVDLTSTVSNRGQGGLRTRILATLLLGALGGGAVKWLGDRYAPVAVFRRRQRRLLRRLGAWLTYLPERAQDDFAVIEDGLRYFDPAGIDPTLTRIEINGDALARVGAAMSAADEAMRDLAKRVTDFRPSLSQVLDQATQAKNRLYANTFPWKKKEDDPDPVSATAEQICDNLLAISAALDADDEASYQAAAKRLFPDLETYTAALENRAAGRTANDLELTMTTRRVVAEPSVTKRNLSQYLLDNVLLITTVVGALIIMIVGYQSQFVGDKSFDGGNGDYLKLFFWAFALQITGVTVADVIGKLGLSASSTAPASAGQ